MNSLYDFLNAHSLYVVLLIVLVIWLGIFIYLLRLDKKVNELYEKSNSEDSDEIPSAENSIRQKEKSK